MHWAERTIETSVSRISNFERILTVSMFKNVQTWSQLLITHIFDASRKTSMPINLVAARRQAHWILLFSVYLVFGEMTFGQMMFQENNVRLERRFGKMTVGWTTIRKNVVRHYEFSLLRRFEHEKLWSNDFQQFFVSAKQRFGKIAFWQNDDSTKWRFGKMI